MSKSKDQKWKVRFSNIGKKQQNFTVSGENSWKAWVNAANKAVGKHGHKIRPHTLHPMSITKLDEEQPAYKSLAHTIRDINLNEARKSSFNIGTHFKNLGLIASEKDATPTVIHTYYPDHVEEELTKLHSSGKIKSKPRVSLLRRRESVDEQVELQEGRKGPTKYITREKQRTGAYRSKISKATKGRKYKRKKDGSIVYLEQNMQDYIRDFLDSKKKLVEVTRADFPPEQAVSKPVPDKQSGGVINTVTHRSGRRKSISLTFSPKLPRKWGGYRPYVNHFTGETDANSSR